MTWPRLFFLCILSGCGCDHDGNPTTMPARVDDETATTQGMSPMNLSDDEVVQLVLDDLRSIEARVPEGKPTVLHEGNYIHVSWTRKLPPGERGSELVLRVTIDSTTRQVVQRKVGV